jgi:AhpD family alkylhydroperoxidase
MNGHMVRLLAIKLFYSVSFFFNTNNPSRHILSTHQGAYYMTNRIDYFSTSPDAMKILLEQESYFSQQFSSSETVSIITWELVKLRISQINQCAFCIDMHSKDALKLGEQPERIFGLNAWQDMPFYSDLERCALTWAEVVTAGNAISDQQYQQTLTQLGNQSLVDLTIAVNAINSWNRIAKVFKPEVGSYKAS